MMETWMIVKGYFKFLMQSDQLEDSTNFQISRFLNQVELFKEDKSGNNSNILILRVILNLHQNRDEIIDRQEATQRYASRHFKRATCNWISHGNGQRRNTLKSIQV